MTHESEARHKQSVRAKEGRTNNAEKPRETVKNGCFSENLSMENGNICVSCIILKQGPPRQSSLTLVTHRAANHGDSFKLIHLKTGPQPVLPCLSPRS
jgi:hypothetical protein